jgi:Ca-activated chloride channel family protein
MPEANFVFLIDVSGSMHSNDKLPLLKSGLKTLVDQLKPTDRISIVTYSGKVKRILESTLVSDASKIKSAISSLTASGSTAGGAAMKMAYEEALANYIDGGNNRVIMGTDGDFNVGVTSTDELVEMVQDYAEKGIYLTICGFGRGNLNDSMMESISNHGNGTYEYVATEDDMTKVFVNERSEFLAVANDTKIQITFDKDKIESYRLIGYENRVLNNEDFENDAKDAGEIGAGQTITALYEVVPLEKGSADEGVLAVFDVRYKKALGEESVALSLDVVPTDASALSSEFSFAAGVAAYGMLLRESPYKGEATYVMARELAEEGLEFDQYGYRADFVDVIKAAETIASKY